MPQTLTILDRKSSLLNHFMVELRDVYIQQDAARFRKNLERIGEIMAYEISQTLPYQNEKIKTPLGDHDTRLLVQQPLLVTIFRAGIPFFQGFLNFFDQAQSGFIGARRSEPENSSDPSNLVEVSLGYNAIPSTESKILIIVDPMLATGSSMAKAVKLLLQKGNPQYIHIATVIAAPEGINYLNAQITCDFKLWTVSLDERLDEKAFIYPGLGDAGDLAYGGKSEDFNT